MQTLGNLQKEIQRILEINPKYKDLPVIYSTDEEGNCYNMILNEIIYLTQVEDISKIYCLETIGFYDEEELDVDINDCNCVIIN